MHRIFYKIHKNKRQIFVRSVYKYMQFLFYNCFSEIRTFFENKIKQGMRALLFLFKVYNKEYQSRMLKYFFSLCERCVRAKRAAVDACDIN
jgi:hypothetical protein